MGFEAMNDKEFAQHCFASMLAATTDKKHDTKTLAAIAMDAVSAFDDVWQERMATMTSEHATGHPSRNIG